MDGRRLRKTWPASKNDVAAADGRIILFDPHQQLGTFIQSSGRARM
jgi:hypothetical protein